MAKAKKGVLLPPAVGYSFKVLYQIFTNNTVSIRYTIRIILTLLINIANLPFRVYEKKIINKTFSVPHKIKDPIFIIGHWRSGTTHLHNILSQDPQMAYVSTFQSVFPDTLFNTLGRFLFEGFAKILMPGTRKGDNVSLDTSYPQEEEFALGDKVPICFYYFWMFPRSIMQFYEQFIQFKSIDAEMLLSWKDNYRLLINKAIKNTHRPRFLSKNPPNTGRIKVLLEMFPNARFVYIHRNPIEVYLSTRNFFQKMLPHLQLQIINDAGLDNSIFELYKSIINDYLQQKDLIPENRLKEIPYYDLESDPILCVRNLYEDLEISGYEKSEKYFKAYVEQMSSYKKNKHQISMSLIEKIQLEWGFAMDQWSYGIPENLEILPDEH